MKSRTVWISRIRKNAEQHGEKRRDSPGGWSYAACGRAVYLKLRGTTSARVSTKIPKRDAQNSARLPFLPLPREEEQRQALLPQYDLVSDGDFSLLTMAFQPLTNL
jgi:hypothetical protein